jgi:polyhydroxyalkanoate synthesis regulator protein
MEKRAHKYKLRLEYLKNAKGEAISAAPLELTFENHDDIFSIIERQKAKGLFGDNNQATEFAIGLKLFSEVMIKHRKDPLFEELAPAFGEFMKKLKAIPAKESPDTNT